MLANAPTVKKFACDNCNKDTVIRHCVKINNEEQKICEDCHSFFDSRLGRLAGTDTDTHSLAELYSKQLTCHFCKREIDSGKAVKDGVECDDCSGRVKKVRGSLGLKRNGHVAEAPAEIIAANKGKKPEFNPFKPVIISDYDQMSLDEYYQHRYADHHFGW